MSFQQGLKLGRTRCIDPNDAILSKYCDDLGSSKVAIEISTQYCKAYADDHTKCDQTVEFSLETDIYISRTLVDFTEKEDYFVKQMDIAAR